MSPLQGNNGILTCQFSFSLSHSCKRSHAMLTLEYVAYMRVLDAMKKREEVNFLYQKDGADFYSLYIGDHKTKKSKGAHKMDLDFSEDFTRAMRLWLGNKGYRQYLISLNRTSSIESDQEILRVFINPTNGRG